MFPWKSVWISSLFIRPLKQRPNLRSNQRSRRPSPLPRSSSSFSPAFTKRSPIICPSILQILPKRHCLAAESCVGAGSYHTRHGYFTRPQSWLHRGSAQFALDCVPGSRQSPISSGVTADVRAAPQSMVDVISRLQCAGLNRLEAEDESSLRERSSDPLGLESCAATARDTAKRRQRIGGVGIQLRKDAIRTPTPL